MKCQTLQPNGSAQMNALVSLLPHKACPCYKLPISTTTHHCLLMKCLLKTLLSRNIEKCIFLCSKTYKLWRAFSALYVFSLITRAVNTHPPGTPAHWVLTSSIYQFTCFQPIPKEVEGPYYLCEGTSQIYHNEVIPKMVPSMTHGLSQDTMKTVIRLPSSLRFTDVETKSTKFLLHRNSKKTRIKIPW